MLNCFELTNGGEMNKKKNYSDEFKRKVILESLKEDMTLAELSSKYGVHKCSIRDWKKSFLENIHLAINPKKGVENYKEQLRESSRTEEKLYKEIGKLTAQLSWAKKKSAELGLDY